MNSYQTLVESQSEDFNYSQNHLRKQLQKYLHKYRTNPKEFADKETLIKKLKKGNCSGLTILVLYSLSLEHQKRASLESIDRQRPRDDWTTIRAALKTISRWDGKRELSENKSELGDSELEQFESILAKVEFFQHSSQYLPIGQGNVEQSFEDTANRQLQRYYTLAGLFVAEDLVKPIQLPYEKSLSTLLNTILKPGSLALISSHEHDIGLANFDGEIYFYDSCNEEGPTRIDDLDEVPAYIFAAYGYDECSYSPIGFRVFSFDQKKPLCLPQRVLLDQTEWVESQQTASVKLPDLSHAENTTPLHMAAWVGCSQSLKFYLEYPFNLDAKGGKTKATAKDLAFDNYNLEALYLLNRAKEREAADASLASLAKGKNSFFKTKASSSRGRSMHPVGRDFSLELK